jgi:RNA polymerase sigma-70 factor, ECF subfamily
MPSREVAIGAACAALAAGVVAMTVSGQTDAAPLRAAEDVDLAALRAGDERAFLALVTRHHGAMLRVARLHVSSQAVAEEVVQEAWLGVLKGLRLFEGRSSLKGWILSICANTAKARGVREARSVPLSSLAADDEQDDAPTVDADRFRGEGDVWAGHWARPPAAWQDEQLASAEAARAVKEAIAQLPTSQRTVITLRDVEGLESSEVCDLLGISEGNQRVLLHRARAKVRAAVEARLAEGSR